MKKLIVLSVVFALVATAAFAVDLGGTVITNVDVVKSSTADGATIDSGAGFGRLRLDGGGEAGEGKFGGYFRVDGKHWSGNAQFFGNAYWKPVDQFKLLVGSNGGDGFIGKEGVTGWGFYQTPCDTGVSMGGDNVWGDSLYGYKINTRSAFFEGGGDGGDNVYLFINPIDILGINVILPFFNGGEIADVFKKAVFQLDVKLDFGNIALTYVGGLGWKDPYTPTSHQNPAVPADPNGGKWVVSQTDGSVSWQADTGKPAEWVLDGDGKAIDDPASIFIYYGGAFGDLSVDFGFGYKFAGADGDWTNPIGVGLGLKYATDSFGVKFRTVANLGGDDKLTKVLVDVLPYFNLGDNLTAYVSVGIGMLITEDDSYTGWHFNPYLQIGEEWGAKFLVGVKVWSNGVKQGDKDAIINWGIPIALSVGF